MKIRTLLIAAMAPALMAPTCAPINEQTGERAPVGMNELTNVLLCDGSSTPISFGTPEIGREVFSCDLVVHEYGCQCNSFAQENIAFVSVIGPVPLNSWQSEIAADCLEALTFMSGNITAETHSARADCFSVGFYNPPN